MPERLRQLLRQWGPGIAVAVVVSLLQLLWVSMDHPGTLSDDRNIFRAAACLDASWGSDQSSMGCFSLSPYPPLLPTWTALHFAAFGTSLQMAVASLWPAWLLLALAAFGFVRRHAGVLAGVTAAALATMLASLSQLRGFYFSEIPLAALALGALACWDASDGLRRKLPAAGLAVCLGLGLMSKWSFGFFLGPPMLLALVVVMLRTLKRRPMGAGASVAAVVAAGTVAAGLGGWLYSGAFIGIAILGALAFVLAALALQAPHLLAEHGRERLIGAGILVLGVGLIAGPWYLGNAGAMQEFLSSNLEFDYDGELMPLAETWSYYPLVTWFRLPTLLLPLFLLGLGRALWPGGRPVGGWAWLVLLSGLVILAVLPYRCDRYIVPAFPALAVPAVLALSGWRRVMRVVCGLVLLWTASYHIGWLFTPGGRDVPLPLPAFMDAASPFGFPGNDRAGLELCSTQLRERPWNFQLVSNYPRPFGEPWTELSRAIAEHAEPGCPPIVLLHCGGHCDWQQLDDALYAAAPFADVRLATEQGPADALRVRELALRYAGVGAESAWPANLFVVHWWRPDQGERQDAALQQLGLEQLVFTPDDWVGTRLWTASAPGPAVGCRR